MNWVLITYLSICGLLLFYYLFAFSRVLFSKPKYYAPEHLPAVSVVICARNEAENLQQNLKVVMIQNYKNFEVIVVNDQSTDNTEDVVSYYCDRNPNLRLINVKRDVEKPLPGKKFPLKVGIESASHDIIVVTDADCKPSNTLWLKTLVSEFLSETQFVLGYSPFKSYPGFVNKLIRYDNVMTAMQYFGFTLSGFPYMGVGRNMAFRKTQFKSYSPTEASQKILSGDDDLFVNNIARGNSTEVAIHKDSYIYSEPEKSWGAWLHQKTRHIKTSFHYSFSSQLLLLIFAFLNFAFYIFPITLFFVESSVALILLVFASVFIVKFITHSKLCIRFQNADLIPYLFFLDFIFILHLPIFLFRSMFYKVSQWK
jgi:cellulose synthase/poly-beta-1,6-N-acetylglucosamine synthase-like glycosyltransferase